MIYAVITLILCHPPHWCPEPGQKWDGCWPPLHSGYFPKDKPGYATPLQHQRMCDDRDFVYQYRDDDLEGVYNYETGVYLPFDHKTKRWGKPQAYTPPPRPPLQGDK